MNSSTETPSGPTVFPFANERMASDSSCIVGRTPSGMFSGHWSSPSAMFGSSLDDLALRRVWNHRAHRSQMSSTSLRRTPFSSLTYAVLVFDVRQAVVLLPFQVHCLKVLVEAGLVAFSSTCFEFENEVLKDAQHGSLAHLPKVFHSHLHDLSKVAAVGFCA